MRPAALLLYAALAVLPAVCLGAQGVVTQSATPVTADPALLPTRIAAILEDPDVASAHWGIVVATLAGEPLFHLDERKLFRPASTAKLFTTAAAMAILGPEHRSTTGVYGALDTRTGIVRGNLTLLGGGDPSFGTDDLPYQHPGPDQAGAASLPAPSADLDELREALKRAGVTRVTGGIVGDDSLFEPSTVPAGWAAEDLVWGYGALPSALSFRDNAVHLLLQTPAPAPTAAGSPLAAIQSDQPTPTLRILNAVHVLPENTNVPPGVEAQDVSGIRQTVRLFGTLRFGSAPVHESLAVHDPAAYAAGALRAELLRGGIAVQGPATSRHAALLADTTPLTRSAEGTESCSEDEPGSSPAPACTHPCQREQPAAPLLAQHTSPPLAQEVAFTLKTSANLHAEVLLHTLGMVRGCAAATAAQGMQALRDWLVRSGLPAAEIFLEDGSGLSTKDLVTPQAEAALLAYAVTQPWFAAWKAALPVGGVDGTLATRFTGEALQGRVLAKTGTLGETRALAGYVRAASGQELIAVILVDNHPPRTTTDRGAMDRIIQTIIDTE